MQYSVIRFFTFTVLSFALAFANGCSGDKKSAQQAPPPPLVTVYDVVAKDQPFPAEYQGQTQGSRAVDVRSRVSGIIQKRLYEEGNFVKEGQQLFQIERAQYEAVVEEAAANLDKAARDWNRIRPLYEKSAVSQKDRDNARATFDSATAALRKAKIDLDYCQVLSPVSGYTSKENYTVGNLVNLNTLLTTVNQTDPLYVNFSIPGADLLRSKSLVSSGRLVVPANGESGAKIKLLDGSLYAGDGRVTFIDSQVDPTTGIVKARAEFPNKNGYVLPGQFVRVYVEAGILTNSILIPQKAVLMTQQGSLVMIVGPDGTIAAQPVKLSETIGNMYLVDSGLKGGERIILEGLMKARPGTKVRVEQPSATGTAPAAQGGEAKPAAQDKK